MASESVSQFLFPAQGTRSKSPGLSTGYFYGTAEQDRLNRLFVTCTTLSVR